MGRGWVLLAAMVAAAAWAAGQAQPSPHGTLLTYAKAVPPYSPNSPLWVWSAKTNGSGGKLLASGEQPSVSPDGRWIAFTRGATVLLVSPAGGHPTVLANLAGRYSYVSQPAWAPDARHLAVVDGSGRLWLLDANSKTKRLLVSPRKGTSIDSFSFSPNSRRLALNISDHTGGDVFVMATSGGKPQRITHDHKDFQVVWGQPGIAFNHGGMVPSGDVWLANPNGSRIRRLTRTKAGIFPAFFSADGRRLLAANPATHNGRLWAVNVRTGAARRLTGWVGDLFPQGLSTDGKTVLAAIGCGGMVGPYGVVETIPFSGGKPHVIVRGPCRASWNR
ncbi:MAG TPA: hypothetical protein VFU52_07760 [Gaiellaceae bacterium]|nr:hypothetical protein [Gaiellaceae bacterium]